MEVLKYTPTAHSLNFLHHDNSDGVDDVISQKNQVNLGSYIEELDLVEWHSILLIELKA